MADPGLWAPRPGLFLLCPLPTPVPQDWAQRVGSCPYPETGFLKLVCGDPAHLGRVDFRVCLESSQSQTCPLSRRGDTFYALTWTVSSELGAARSG